MKNTLAVYRIKFCYMDQRCALEEMLLISQDYIIFHLQQGSYFQALNILLSEHADSGQAMLQCQL